MNTATRSITGILAVALLVITACHESDQRRMTTRAMQNTDEKMTKVSGPPAKTPAPTDYRVTGPNTHENLAVYLVHGKATDNRDYLTLEEGLSNDLVTIKEKDQAQVQELIIENRSDRPLYLHEGDRLKGGKQDRIIYSNVVIEPKSGEQTVPSFCIEPSRWAANDGGNEFAQSSTMALKSVRSANKVSKSQQSVWSETEQARQQISRQGMVANMETSSLNEAMDSEGAKKARQPYVEALQNVREKKGDVIGFAFAVNGTIEEAAVYPNTKLAGEIYPRMLKSYALMAAMDESDDAGDSPDVEAVKRFMTEPAGDPERREQIDQRNAFQMHFEDGHVQSDTFYQQQRVHRQWLRHEEKQEGRSR